MALSRCCFVWCGLPCGIVWRLELWQVILRRHMSDHTAWMVGQLVNDELENIREEAVLSLSVYSVSIARATQIRPGA